MNVSNKSAMLRGVMPILIISERGAHMLQTASNLAIIAGTVLVLIGTISAIWSQASLSEYATLRLSNNELQTEKARRDAAKANEGQARANERAATLENETATARLELEKLKQKQSPRMVSAAQQQLMARLLESSPKGKVDVAVRGTDLEALSFAESIANTLRICGFDAQVYAAAMFGGPGPVPVQGLTLRVRTEPRPAHAEPMLRALNGAGISCAFEQGQNFPEDKIQLFVAAKPL